MFKIYDKRANSLSVSCADLKAADLTRVIGLWVVTYLHQSICKTEVMNESGRSDLCIVYTLQRRSKSRDVCRRFNLAKKEITLNSTMELVKRLCF